MIAHDRRDGDIDRSFDTAPSIGRHVALADRYVYARLPAVGDFGFFRVGGAGIGNCFFAYFHAAMAAEAVGARMLAPTWANLGLGSFLRGDRTHRRYAAMLTHHPDELHGAKKLLALVRFWFGRREAVAGTGDPVFSSDLERGLRIVRLDGCRFGTLVAHRAAIRRRLLQILAVPPVEEPHWGRGDYAALHVRLGDFAAAVSPGDLSSVNTRLPMTWYLRCIDHVRSAYPGLPILIFSDGHDAELAPLTAIEGVRLMRGRNDIDELLAMASARLLVGSNSTFSQWAAFLGDMPTIWASEPAERMVSDGVPMTILDRM